MQMGRRGGPIVLDEILKGVLGFGSQRDKMASLVLRVPFHAGAGIALLGEIENEFLKIVRPYPAARIFSRADCVQDVVGETNQIDSLFFQSPHLFPLVGNGRDRRVCPFLPLLLGQIVTEKFGKKLLNRAIKGHMRAQNLLEITDRPAKNVDPIIEAAENLLFYCIGQPKIGDLDAIRVLAQAVQAPDPLFHAHRIPWEVVVYECAAELKVQTLRSNFR